MTGLEESGAGRTGRTQRLPQSAQTALGLAAAVIWVWTAQSPDSGEGPLLAYTGPGAGFAFLGSFLALLTGFLLSALSLLAFPFRMAWRVARRRRGYQHASIKKLIFLGLDGLDPRLTERFMAEGKLPNFSRL